MSLNSPTAVTPSYCFHRQLRQLTPISSFVTVLDTTSRNHTSGQSNWFITKATKYHRYPQYRSNPEAFTTIASSVQASAYRQHQSSYKLESRQNTGGLAYSVFILVGKSQVIQTPLQTTPCNRNDYKRSSGARPCSNTFASRNSHKATKQNLSSAEGTTQSTCPIDWLLPWDWHNQRTYFDRFCSSQVAQRLVACFPLLV